MKGIKYLKEHLEVNNLVVPYKLLASCSWIFPRKQNGLVALIKRDGIHIEKGDIEVILAKNMKAYAKARINGDYLINSSM